MIPRALTIATSDSGGGAGIQADLKAFAAAGVHGMSVLVALTAQNTKAVTAVHELPPEFVREQLDAIWDDLGVDAAKTGMLFSKRLIAAVAEFLEAHRVPLVVDPVMVASSGAQLCSPTPSRRLWTALPARDRGHAEPERGGRIGRCRSGTRRELAEKLHELGAPAVVVTGGHGDEPVDHLFDGDGTWRSRSSGTTCPRRTAPAARTPRRSPPSSQGRLARGRGSHGSARRVRGRAERTGGARKRRGPVDVLDLKGAA